MSCGGALRWRGGMAWWKGHVESRKMAGCVSRALGGLSMLTSEQPVNMICAPTNTKTEIHIFSKQLPTYVSDYKVM